MNETREPIISLRHVDKHFGALHVLKDINLDVYKGEVVVVIGPSGSGKSTLCRTINRLETIDSGEILFEGKPLPLEGKELAALRSKLTDKIFDAVLTELSDFTNTTEYKKLMIRSFAEIIEALPDEELEFFVRQEDMILCDEICNALDRTLEIKPADDIKLGGVKAVGIKTESLADDTLDTKLDEQKKLFVEHSGFKI